MYTLGSLILLSILLGAVMPVFHSLTRTLKIDGIINRIPIRVAPTHFSSRFSTYCNKHESTLVNHSLNIMLFILIFLHEIMLPNVGVINSIVHKLAYEFCIHTLISLTYGVLHH